MLKFLFLGRFLLLELVEGNHQEIKDYIKKYSLLIKYRKGSIFYFEYYF